MDFCFNSLFEIYFLKLALKVHFYLPMFTPCSHFLVPCTYLVLAPFPNFSVQLCPVPILFCPSTYPCSCPFSPFVRPISQVLTFVPTMYLCPNPQIFTIIFPQNPKILDKSKIKVLTQYVPRYVPTFGGLIGSFGTFPIKK